MISRRIFRTSLAIMACLNLSGCLHPFHSIPEPPREHIEGAKQIPAQARGSVYLFLFNGVDPLEFANVSGVQEYLAEVGFGKVYYGQLYHVDWFLDEMRHVWEICPDSQIIVAGFDYGADAARKLVREASESGIQIQELIYLEPRGVGLSQLEVAFPPRRITTIQGHRLFGHGVAPVGSDTVYLPYCGRYGVPTHPAALELLAERMRMLAGTVPLVSVYREEVPLVSDPAPTPRPVEAQKPSLPDDWDFLAPSRGRSLSQTSYKPRNGIEVKKD